MLARVTIALYALLFSLPGIAQDPPQYGTPFSGVPDPRDAVIYQVNMRAFSSSRNFQGVINRLDQIRDLGVNVIYLMPVHPVGTLNAFNSPYCIKDLQAVGAEFGTLTDLRNLVAGAHSRGMAVIMDWVANQTSWDHPWITQHPDWYLRDGNGNIQNLNGWTDVAALNFSNNSMRTAMINAMRYWVFTANIDGFRFDFADNPPIDFWQQTIASLRSITSHKLLLMAEGTRAANYTAGFDYNFGMQFYYNSLRPIFTGGSATAINNSNTVEYQNAGGTQQIVRYLTNHDVNGAEDTPLELFGGINGSLAAFVVSAYMKGVPFIYNGQEVAFPTRIPFPFTATTINWSLNPSVTAEYKKLIGFRNSSTALRRGNLVSYTNNDVCAFTKTSGSESVLVMVNLRNNHVNFSLPAALANTSWKDGFSGATVTLGTSVSLSNYQYLVLTNANVSTVPVTGVSVTPAAVTLNAGLTTQLTATVAPANATNKNVSWASGNTAVATVNASGLVTAVAPGTATITATTQDGNKTASSVITVQPASSFTVHFYKPVNWGTAIKIYWWNTSPAGILTDATWPGINMTAEGDGWYSYTFTNITSTNLIFNDGANQTADLSRSSNGWYMNNTWYNSNPGTPSGTTWYNIVNRWQSTSYLYDTGNGQVRYGSNPGANNAYQWTLVDAGDGYVQLKNRATGNFMHVENQNGSVQCGSINSSWYSAMWNMPAATDGYNYIQNRWQPSQRIHLENLLGYAQYSGAQSGWYSAMWKLVNPVSARQATVVTTPELQVFPNPVTARHFIVQSGEPVTVVVHDVNGRALLSKKGHGTIRFDHQLAAGVYMVQIISRQKTITKQLVVQ